MLLTAHSTMRVQTHTGQWAKTIEFTVSGGMASGPPNTSLWTGSESTLQRWSQGDPRMCCCSFLVFHQEVWQSPAWKLMSLSKHALWQNGEEALSKTEEPNPSTPARFSFGVESSSLPPPVLSVFLTIAIKVNDNVQLPPFSWNNSQATVNVNSDPISLPHYLLISV
jgi:hypothetical protein